MEQKNFDIYGSEPIPWSRPLEELEKFEAAGPGKSTWLATTRPDGLRRLPEALFRPLVAAVLIVRG